MGPKSHCGARWRAHNIATMRTILAAISLPFLALGAMAAETWTFEATPYLWAAGMKGDVGIGQLGANGVEATFPDIMKSLRAGFMGSLEARSGRHGFFLDAIYMKLDQDHPAPRGFLGDVQARATQQAYTAAATWRAIEGSAQLDLFLGARASDVKLDLKLSSSALAPQGRSGVKSRSWVDGFVGARATFPCGERWTFTGYADIGGGGSDSTWQLAAGAGYAFSPATSAKFGYRLLKVDYHNDDFLYDISSGGAYAGVAIRF